MNEPEQNEPGEPRLPAKLAAELKALYAPRRLVPPQVDEAVLSKARRYLAHLAQLRPIVHFPRWLAAAAAIALGAWLGSLWLPSNRSAPVAREDVNRDGRVDVLDAFALALRLQQGSIADRLFDINGDGIVDQRDIDAIAAKAVKLEKGEG